MKNTLLIGILIALLLCFCGGGDKKTNNNTSDTITWSGYVQPLLNQKCSPCHTTDGSKNFYVTTYELITAKSYIIIPNNPDGSLIIQKLEGTNLPAMPMTGNKLPQAEIDSIRKWITQGAQNN
jgi:hypothetical protein